MTTEFNELGKVTLTVDGVDVTLSPGVDVEAFKQRLARTEACHHFGSKRADHLAKLLAEVRTRLAKEAGAEDQLLLCQAVECLQQVRDVVKMAGKVLQEHELVFGISTMSNHGGLVKEVEQLNWAIAVLMGRTTEPAPV